MAERVGDEKREEQIPKKTTTENLESKISEEKDFNQFLSEYAGEIKEKSVAEYLNELLELHHIAKREVLERTYLDLNYGYQIFNGTRKNPARDFLLQIALAFPLTVEETKRLLCFGGVGNLYPRIKRDAYIMFALFHHKSVEQVNHFLLENEMVPFRK